MPSVKTGAHGWPLVPSTHFPGELTLACPNCGSLEIALSVIYPGRGSGPGGRGRLSDPGALNTIKCQSCGKHDYEPAKPWKHF